MASERPTKSELPIVHFVDQAAWRAWLDQHHTDASGVWLQLLKKVPGIEALTYAGALDVALCYGWIDGQKKSHDAASWLQKFTPRGAKSIWSKVNREHIERLTNGGEMRPAGLAAVASAKQDGRWDAAYDSHSSATVPEDFAAELAARPEAAMFFATLNSGNRYSFLFRIQTAKKPETRARRIQQFVDMLERHEKL